MWQGCSWERSPLGTREPSLGSGTQALECPESQAWSPRKAAGRDVTGQLHISARGQTVGMSGATGGGQ